MIDIRERSISIVPWIGLLLLGAGLVSTPLLRQLPFNRFSELLLLALLAWAAAWLQRRLIRTSWASGMALAWVVPLVGFVGILPSLATLLMVLAAAALGAKLFPQRSLALQVTLGLLLLAGAMGWGLLLPLHNRWVYLLLFVSMIIWGRSALTGSLSTAGAAWREGVAAAPRWAAFAVMLVGVASTACWLPTLQYDDLAYHLRLAWQLMEGGVYQPAPEFQVWALAPWGSDVVQALPQVLAGAESRGAVNAVWLLLLVSGTWRFSMHLDASPMQRWLVVAMVASLPLTPGLATSMQTELPSAAVLVWMAALVAGPRNAHLAFWLMLAILAGGLAASKTIAAAMSLPVLAWALARHPWPSPLRIAAVMATGFGVGGASYIYAAWIAGNPVLPLFNGFFQSPYFASQNFADLRYQQGFDGLLPWRLTFHTSRYFESRDGAAGISLVALAGFWISALIRPSTRIAAVVATAVLLLPLMPVQYLRYAYPGIVMFCVVAVSAVECSRHRPLVWFLVAVIVVNVTYHANGNWMLRTGALKDVVRSIGNDGALFERFAPERVLAGAIRDSGDIEGTVLLLDPAEPFIAEFGTRGRSVSWYAPTIQKAAVAAASDGHGRAWAELMRSVGARHVVLRTDTTSEAQRRALQMLGATLRQEARGRQWWSLPAPGHSEEIRHP